ncbi:hypothetical protein AcV7_004007 [Taiwanofungus camphoratus]|nr:hypothetical protein AcV7_004007 [Antrodia cinnamomea]
MYEINPTQGPPAHQHQHQQRRPDQAADVKERGPPIWLTISRASLLFGEHDLPQTRSLVPPHALSGSLLQAIHFAPRTHQLLSPRSPTGRSFVWPAVDLRAPRPIAPPNPVSPPSPPCGRTDGGARWWPPSSIAPTISGTVATTWCPTFPDAFPGFPEPKRVSAHSLATAPSEDVHPSIVLSVRRGALPAYRHHLYCSVPIPRRRVAPRAMTSSLRLPQKAVQAPVHTKDSTSCRAGCEAEHPWFCRVPYADASLWSARVVSLAIHAGANAASGPRSGATDTGRRRIPDAARCTIRRECSPLPAAQVCPSFLCALGPPCLANRPRKPAPLVERTPAARLCTTSISLHSSFPGSTLPSPANLHPDLHAALRSPPPPHPPPPSPSPQRAGARTIAAPRSRPHASLSALTPLLFLTRARGPSRSRRSRGEAAVRHSLHSAGSHATAAATTLSAEPAHAAPARDGRRARWQSRAVAARLAWRPTRAPQRPTFAPGARARVHATRSALPLPRSAPVRPRLRLRLREARSLFECEKPAKHPLRLHGRGSPWDPPPCLHCAGRGARARRGPRRCVVALASLALSLY